MSQVESLVAAVADWIEAYRTERRPPAEMRDACLAEVSGATGSDFAIGLITANRRAAA